MAWSGYFMFGGTELINATRTESYARNFGVQWFRPVYNEVGLPWLLGEDRYTTPLQDDAPWTDPDNLDSYDFYGVYPLEVTGIEDGTVDATVTESVIDGGYIGRVRKKSRTVVYSAVLTGASECAVEYGMRWLRGVLTGGPCFNQDYGSCGGADMCYLSCPPIMGDIEPTYSPGDPAIDSHNLAWNPISDSGNVATWWYETRVTQAAGAGFLRATVNDTQMDSMAQRINSPWRGTDPKRIAVVPGETVRASGQVRSSASTPMSSWLVWLDDAGNAVGGFALSPPVSTNPTTWADVPEISGVAPVGATTAQVRFGIEGTGPRAIGDTFDVRHVSIVKGTTPVPYFDGSTPASNPYTYAWNGVPNDSVSIRYKDTWVEDPLPTGEDCYNKIGRSLHEVTCTVGPTVTNKLEMINGGAAWQVTWTMVAANPAEFGVAKQLIVGFLDPAVEVPYAGGEVPPGGDYDENGHVQTDTPCAAPVFRPVYDPLCALLAPPPDVPSVVPMCFSFPVNYLRTSFVIPREEIPLWTTVTPVIQLTTKTVEARSVRVRFYADMFDTGDPSQDPCNFCGDVVFSYIPPGSTIVLDCADREVYIDQPGVGRRRADALVTNSKGEPFEWPEFSCGYGYVVTVDMPQQMTQRPIVDLSLVPRMV